MLRSLLPTPSTLLGCASLDTGVTIVALATIAWQALCIATGFRSAWVLYSVWMLVSSAALFYGRHKRDLGHVRWFALALFVDVFVYLAYIPFDAEFAMTDAQQCAVAMTTNRDLTMEYCLGHVHEIKNIAYMMRVAAVLAKIYLASVARSYELSFVPANHKRRIRGGS
ncbi:hypothetical protein IWW38_000134 [Coemansia aciculifera]|uniref:Uncharacterized protein n=1 Tax=Coemansia aciculifera TaxID=417176 RepID=A0ACC1MB46_9FUNG|nr:hypothetical protein IWW38_000134 [Coemansia aciculifera]